MPAGGGSTGCGKNTKQFERQITIKMKETLRNVNTREPAVALNFAFIGIELHAPDRSFLNLRVHMFPELRQEVAAQRFGIFMEADPPVQNRVTVTDENTT